MRVFQALLSSLPLFSITFLCAQPALTQSIEAAPDGTGTVITTPDGKTHNITGGQLSGDGANLFHSFEQFGLDPGEIANFISNPEIQNILGRIIGGDPSVINGLIQVTGGNPNLYLMNPSGFIFGSGASLNVPAAFNVTTADQISFGDNIFNAFGDNNYTTLVGNPTSFNFTTDNPGSIVNLGDLSIGKGQSISLTAGEVVNTGTISTPQGNITITAVPGENKVHISQEGMLLSLEVDLDNVPASGNVAATALPELLTGGETGIVAEGETVTLPNGETLPVTTGTAVVSGELDTSGTEGGNVTVTGDYVALSDATINAAGESGGGSILVGGDYRGEGTIPNAQRTYVNSNSVLDASAITEGDGGKVILWADELTVFNGNIAATGGEVVGNGGFVEVSGKDSLIFNGEVDTSAPNGGYGTLLLDPKNIAVIGDGSPADGDDSDSDAFALTGGEVLASQEPTGGTFNIYESELEGMSGDTNILLEATQNISINDLPDDELLFAPGSGSITFRANTDNASQGTFTMQGTDDVIRAEGRNVDISGYAVNVSTIDTSGEEPGNITLTSQGGDIKVVGGLNANATGEEAGGDITLDVTAGLGAINISSSGVTVSSTSELGEGGNITFNTAGGNISTLDVLATSGGEEAGGEIQFNIAENDEGTGQIDTSSGTLDASSATGEGGKITLTTAAGNIDTADIDVSSGGEENGGEVFQTIEGGIGSIDATSGTIDATSVNGDGGEVELATNEGNISVSDILTSSSEGGAGGNVKLEIAAGGGSINTTTGLIDATAAVGDGGEVELKTFQGNISTANIDTFSDDAEGVGGKIELNVEDVAGSIDTTAGIITSGGTVADGGNIEFTTQDGNLQVADVNASATGNGNAGSIKFETGDSGSIDTTNGVIDATVVNGIGGNIDFDTQDGGMQTANLDTSASDEGTGGNINLNINGSPGLLNATSGTIDASSAGGDGGNVTLRTGGSNINTANVNTFSGGDGNAGTVTYEIAANGEVTGAIDTTAGTVDASSADANGGDVLLTAPDGNIDTADITTSTNGAGNAGKIDLTIQREAGSIDTSNGILNATSAGGDGGAILMDVAEGSIATNNLNTFSENAGNVGGNINLTVNGTEGAIDVTNGILTTGGTVANGGNVTLDTTATTTSGTIQTSTINTSSTGSGNGGDITVRAGEIGNIDTSNGLLNTTSANGDGGVVTLNVIEGLIQPGNIDTSTDGEGTGGAINLIAESIPGNIDTSSSTLDARSADGDGGAITINTAGGDIRTADVLADSNGDGKGGDITFDISPNDEVTGQVDTTAGTISSTSENGSGGDILMSVGEGNIDVADVNAFSDGAGTGGNITLSINGGVGSIDATVGVLDATSAGANGGNVTLDSFEGNISTASIQTFSEDTTSTGGNISLSINGTIGSIDTTANEGQLLSGSTVASGGDVSLSTEPTTTGGNINVQTINTSSTGDGNGGNIEIIAGDAGDIDTTVGILDSTSINGDGGNISLTVQSGQILPGEIDASVGGDGTAGDINLTATDIPGIIDTSSITLDARSADGDGGAVTIDTAGGDISTADVLTSSGGDGAGGAITFDIALSDERVGQIDTTAGIIDSSAVNGSGGAVSMTTAEGNISTANINSFSDGVGTGGNISLNIQGGLGSVDTTVGVLDATSDGANGGNVTLDSFDGNISTASIETFSEDTASTGGNISLSVNGSAGSIDTTANEGQLLSGSTVASGGNVSLSTEPTTTGGNINVQTINSSSTGDGNGGNIEIIAGDAGDVDTTIGVLDSTSVAGNGGDISVTVQSGQILPGAIDSSTGGEGTAGDINLTATDIPGIIDTSSITLDARSALGDGGAVTIDTAGGDISTADVLTNSGGDGNGGNITFDIAQNDERTGQIDTTAGTIDSSSAGGNGGAVSLTAAEGNVSTSDIQSSGGSLDTTGGDISLTVEGGTGSIDTTTGVLTSGGTPGTGGDISLAVNEGSISADDLTASSTDAGDGGNVNVDINTGTGNIDLSTATVDASSELANGGNVTVTSADGQIAANSVDTSSDGTGNGGNMTMSTNEAGLIDLFNGSETTLDASSVSGDGGKVELESDVVRVPNINAEGGATGGDIVLTGDEINIGDGFQVESNGELTLRSFSLDQDIRVGGQSDVGASILDITSEDIGRIVDGFEQIVVGQDAGTGVITIVDDPDFPDPVIYQQEIEQE